MIDRASMTGPNTLRYARPMLAVALLLGSSACAEELTLRDQQFGDLQARIAESYTDEIDAVTAARGSITPLDLKCTQPVKLGSGAVDTRLMKLFPDMARSNAGQREATAVSAGDIYLHRPQPTTLVVSCEMPALAITMSHHALTVAYEVSQ